MFLLRCCPQTTWNYPTQLQRRTTSQKTSAQTPDCIRGHLNLASLNWQRLETTQHHLCCSSVFQDGVQTCSLMWIESRIRRHWKTLPLCVTIIERNVASMKINISCKPFKFTFHTECQMSGHFHNVSLQIAVFSPSHLLSPHLCPKSAGTDGPRSCKSGAPCGCSSSSECRSLQIHFLVKQSSFPKRNFFRKDITPFLFWGQRLTVESQHIRIRQTLGKTDNHSK